MWEFRGLVEPNLRPVSWRHGSSGNSARLARQRRDLAIKTAGPFQAQTMLEAAAKQLRARKMTITDSNVALLETGFKTKMKGKDFRGTLATGMPISSSWPAGSGRGSAHKRPAVAIKRALLVQHAAGLSLRFGSVARTRTGIFQSCKHDAASA